MNVEDNHFVDFIHFLTTGMTPERYTSQQKEEFVVPVTNFSIIAGHFYKMGVDEILRWYVPDFERNSILAEAHGGAAGGHYVGKVTVQKILRAGLWWPTMHKYPEAYCRACNACQRMGRPSQRDDLPLNPQVSLQPCEEWEIDFIGPIQTLRKKTCA